MGEILFVFLVEGQPRGDDPPALGVVWMCSGTFLVHQAAIAGLSYGRFKATHIRFHCQLPSKEPLVIGRRGWKQKSLSGKPG